MTRVCPNCGQPLVDVPQDIPRLTPIQQTIFEMLQRAGDNGVSADLIEDRIYRDYPRVEGAIRSHMFNLRRKLVRTGLHIDSDGWGRREGYRATYRLVENHHTSRER
jgi:hypothetical protein